MFTVLMSVIDFCFFFFFFKQKTAYEMRISDWSSDVCSSDLVVNLKPQSKLKSVRPIPANADFIAAIGDNRKLVVFPLSELPEMARGQGVQLQRYRAGGLSDAIAFRLEDGLSWPLGGESGRVDRKSTRLNSSQ